LPGCYRSFGPPPECWCPHCPTPRGGEQQATSAVLIGFILVFVCDVQFAVWKLTPPWWIKLRALLTAVVLGCLLIGLLA